MSKVKLAWDTCAIGEAQAEYLMAEEGLTEDAAYADVWHDADLFDTAWRDLCDALTEQMARINRHGRPWTTEVRNFGWRHQDGGKSFGADTGAELLRAVLPNTECTFTIDFDFVRHTITINNAHHDAPCGGELYIMRPMTLREQTAAGDY
jgi:hypothetical protein